MSYRRFTLAEIELEAATFATTATVQPETVADVAGVAGPIGGFAVALGGGGANGNLLGTHGAQGVGGGGQTGRSSDAKSDIAEMGAARHSADRFQIRPAGWMPEPGPGITILRPAIEVSAREYDAHLDALIAALPAGSPEAQRMAFAKRKGWCVERGGERIYVKGRT